VPAVAQRGGPRLQEDDGKLHSDVPNRRWQKLVVHGGDESVAHSGG
jgi:hypothetical protein